jgi:drug/metabolite transporter (DMT)-like permease
MHFNAIPYLSNEMHSITLMLLFINGILHVIFAGAVAKDAGVVAKRLHKTYLVSPMTWAFATLLGGVIVAAVYWFMHHLNLKVGSGHH